MSIDSDERIAQAGLTSFRGLDRFLMLPLARIAMGIMMLTVTVQVLARSLFRIPTPWVFALVVDLAMPAAVFLGLLNAVRNFSNVRMSAITSRLRSGWQLAWRCLALVVGGVVFAAIAYKNYGVALGRVGRGTGTTQFAVPDALSYGLVSLGAAVAALACLMQTIRIFFNRHGAHSAEQMRPR